MEQKIEGAGTSNISITGVEDLVGGDWNILPDRIEAGTCTCSRRNYKWTCGVIFQII